MPFKVIKTMREHWKKSIFFSACVAYAAKYVIKWHNEAGIMREYCLKARDYGRQTLKATERPRKIVVFLNPAAKDGKTKHLLEKHVLPLLHLAGLEVHVVRTEHEGQAKAYMGVLDNTIVDGIVVAGGDGTVSEIVTGLLRRDDDLSLRVPIGVLPLGLTNTFTSSIFPKEAFEVERFCKASMAIIENKSQAHCVMQVTPETEKHQKSVYLLSNIRWGVHSDVERAKGKYWYWGPWKSWYCYMKKTFFGEWPPLVKADVEISSVCDGCSRCVTSPSPPVQNERPWWSNFLIEKKQTVNDPRLKIDNQECGVFSATSRIETPQLNVDLMTSADSDACCIQITTAPEENKIDFIKNKGSIMRPFKPTSEGNRRIGAFHIIPYPNNLHPWLVMDSEKYEVMPFSVKVLKDKIKVYTPL